MYSSLILYEREQKINITLESISYTITKHILISKYDNWQRSFKKIVRFKGHTSNIFVLISMIILNPLPRYYLQIYMIE